MKIFCNFQIAYFIAVLQGKVQLPSRDDMLKDAALPQGLPKKKAHYMLEKSLDYYNELAVDVGFDPLADWYLRACLVIFPHLYTEPMYFREKKLYFNNDGSIDFY